MYESLFCLLLVFLGFGLLVIMMIFQIAEGLGNFFKSRR